ncbi:hypothetical protein V5N11_032314 [Cardamine amara subsp. amara]|uniref:RNase H type-1 domain-containing protein n=1 Tax=Cardamine amara subsp. amara TaxID=228776 RepID=A0ABD1BR86_CARAN
MTSQPLRTILHSPSQSGRLAKWAIELSEYDIEYRPRTAAKAQVLADFIIELAVENSNTSSSTPKWTLHVDGASSRQGSGVGLRLTSFEGETIEQSYRLGFNASNNEVEYEALIAGLKLAIGLGIRELSAFSDSQLVASQFHGEYDTRDERMEAYLQVVRDLVKQFDKFVLTRIPRGENTSADALAALASTSDPLVKRIIPVEGISSPSISIPVKEPMEQVANNNLNLERDLNMVQTTYWFPKKKATICTILGLDYLSAKTKDQGGNQTEPEQLVEVENSDELSVSDTKLIEPTDMIICTLNGQSGPTEGNTQGPENQPDPMEENPSEAGADGENTPSFEEQVLKRPDWRIAIMQYMKEGVVPPNKWDARKLKQLSSKYCIIDSKLYKRSISRPYLVCVHGLDMLKVMAELHEHSCGSHSGERALAIRIKKQGYFWPTIVADCETYSAKCDKCQRHAPIIHQPAELMSSISAPYPFMRWSMDIMGPMVPSGDNELRFVLVFTDYFTKWIEAEAYSQITKEQVEKFIW